MSKLDRFLITPHREEYSNDHFPIMLDVNRINRGKESFKFEYVWFKLEGFVD